jgi:hypothetical protein
MRSLASDTYYLCIIGLMAGLYATCTISSLTPHLPAYYFGITALVYSSWPITHSPASMITDNFTIFLTAVIYFDISIYATI